MTKKRLDKQEPLLDEVIEQASPVPNDDLMADLLKANPYLKPLVQQIKQKRHSLLLSKDKPAEKEEQG